MADHQLPFTRKELSAKMIDDTVHVLKLLSHEFHMEGVHYGLEGELDKTRLAFEKSSEMSAVAKLLEDRAFRIGVQ